MLIRASTSSTLSVTIILILLFSLTNIQRPFAQNFSEGRIKVINEKLEELSTSIPGLDAYANFSLVDAPLQDLFRGLAETHGLNINVDPGITVRITNNFTQVKVKDLIVFIVNEYELDIKFVNSIMSFYKIKPAPTPSQPYTQKKLSLIYDPTHDNLTVDLNNDSIRIFAKQITELTTKNVVISPRVSNYMLNGYIKQVPFDNALEKIALVNNLQLRKTSDGFYVFDVPDDELPIAGNGNNNRSNSQQPNSRMTPQQGVSAAFEVKISVVGTDSLLFVDAINTPIIDIIKEASSQFSADFIFFSDIKETTTCRVNNIKFDDLLSFLLTATEYTYNKQQDVYLIGNRNQERFRSSKLVRLDFRSVEGIETFIPAEISKGVDIKLFPELNGLILSGSLPHIQEIESLLHQLDQPVPNIMIEVMVVEINKGYSLRTGLKAFLGDSVPTRTSGQIFPGTDITISSGTINEFLNKIGNLGPINLGKVTPQFYASLEAMEQNNNANIRSTPKLSSLNGHEATLTIGQSVYYLEQTQNITGGVSPITSLSQRFNKVEANLNLKINPSVAGDEHITLKIEAEFSDFIPSVVQNAPPGNTTRKFASQIRVRNEDMIILGGLERATQANSGSGVPLISRIPVLKWIFSSRSNEKKDDRLIVFIKPTIVY